MDNGPELISQALQSFCEGRVGLSYIPPGTPWNNGHIESFNNRLRRECLNRNHWTNLLEARVVIGDFKHEHNQRHRHSALGYLTATEHRCPMQPHPSPGGLRNQLKSISTQPGSITRRTDYRGPATCAYTGVAPWRFSSKSGMMRFVLL
jgi:putative transposase